MSNWNLVQRSINQSNFSPIAEASSSIFLSQPFNISDLHRSIVKYFHFHLWWSFKQMKMYNYKIKRHTFYEKLSKENYVFLLFFSFPSKNRCWEKFRRFPLPSCWGKINARSFTTILTAAKMFLAFFSDGKMEKFLVFARRANLPKSGDERKSEKIESEAQISESK